MSSRRRLPLSILILLSQSVVVVVVGGGGGAFEGAAPDVCYRSIDVSSHFRTHRATTKGLHET